MSGDAETGREPTPFERARAIDAWCDRFESDWRAGRCPRVEDYLADAPEAIRSDLRPELVAVQEALRRAVGERTRSDEPRSPSPSAGGPAGRGVTPQANCPTADRATPTGGPDTRPDPPAPLPSATGMDEESVFAPAPEEAGTAERGALLEQACSGDTGLRARVQRLLAACVAPPGMPDQTAGATGPLAFDGEAPPDKLAGALIVGRYRLREEIGQGAMGSVWAAEQTLPVRRPVAVKLVKPGMDTRSVLARFEAERQALALMDHPNIARVLDGGTTEAGRPFFAMELVPGVPITQYCDDARLGVAERLDLFVTVCQAVQHAHTKGIIHRDLKPSNILVGPCDGRPVPKVIDFGLAKAMHQPLTEHTLHTAQGAVMGTPLYMSPEQAQLDNLDVDTRTDVYALGVILYELLTGTTPLERARFERVGWEERLRLIREEDPPCPSARLGGSGSLPGVAARRHADPARLTRLVRGELDWIVMKCLDKDRSRRYETANALARDIQRYRADEPVEAGPPGAAYRLRMFARRHRRALAGAGAFGMLLLLGTAISTWQAVRATSAERRAFEETAIARAVNEFLRRDLLGQADIANQAAEEGRDPGITVRELLDRAARRIDARFRGQDLTEAAIRLTLGQAYRALGEYAQAQRHLERALHLRTRKLGAEHRETLESARALAGLLADRRRDDEAERLYRRVLEVRGARLGLKHPDTLQSMNDLGDHCGERGRFDEAEPLLVRALELRRALLGDGHPDTLESMDSVAGLHWSRNEYAAAEPWYKRARAGRQATLGADHPRTLDTVNSLALVYMELGRLDEAESLFDQILATHRAKLGAEHPLTLYVLHNLAELHRRRGRFDEAERLLKRVIEARRGRLGPDHPATMQSLGNLAAYYSMSGRLDEAEPLLKEVVDVKRRTLGKEDPETIISMSNLGVSYRERGRLAEAEALLRGALSGARMCFGLGDETVTHQIINHLALLHEKQGKPHLSEPNLREVVAYLRQHSAHDTTAYANELGYLTENLMAQKKYAEAEPILRESLAIGERKHPDQWRTFVIRSSLGTVLREQGKYAEAEPLLLHGYAGLKEREVQIPPQSRRRIAEALGSTVRLYESWGRREAAAAWEAKLRAARPGSADPDAHFPDDPFASP